ncbi:TVP38/TMEM64 family protein [Streptomyces sp. TS71-3]|nr:TVP38/TMEM64 family protein [Streptomyces sp. TS71-3]
MLDSAAPPVTDPAPPARPGLAQRCVRAMVSSWFRLWVLLVLLAVCGACVLLFKPQRMLAGGWPHEFSGVTAVVVFTAVYSVLSAVFVPRPLMSLAAGALFGSVLGLTVALVGSVAGGAISFGLGRLLGQDALRPLLRNRMLKAVDHQLSKHGFRSMMAIRLFPGVPFWAANYAAAVSRMSWPAFLIATFLGTAPNTAAYVFAGARAAEPMSPVFLIAMGFLVVTGLAAAVVAWRHRHRLRDR